MNEKSLAFCKQVLCLVYFVFALEFVILRLGLSYGSDSSLAHLLYGSVFRLYDLRQSWLRGGSGHPLSYRFYPEVHGFWAGIAQLILPITGICIAVLLASVVRAIFPAKVSRAILQPWIAIAGVLAWILSWWYLKAVSTTSLSILAVSPAWLAAHVPRIFYACVLLAGAVSVFYISFRQKPITFLSVSVYAFFLILQFGIWFVAWNTVGGFWLAIFPISVSAILGGLVWLLRQENPNERRLELARRHDSGWIDLFSSLISIGLLLSIWLPQPAIHLTRLTNMNSLNVRMQRTGCFGGCPAYLVSIEGTGRVTYTGEKDVAVINTQMTAVPADQIRGLLNELDRVGFFGLEDKTFYACSDTPRVAVSVSVPGREKTVVSDSSCVGPNSGPQAKFVAVADKIDKLVGSDRWVHKIASLK